MLFFAHDASHSVSFQDVCDCWRSADCSRTVGQHIIRNWAQVQEGQWHQWEYKSALDVGHDSSAYSLAIYSACDPTGAD